MISYDNKTLLRDGKPWMPTMGEMQFSRTDHRHWRELLLKMKAGGIDIVSTYVFWIHHEEVRGKFRFDGSRNLRKFIRLVQECGMYLFLRPGPWIHAECRNGGFPNWLCEEDFPVRSNHPGYLACVENYFREVYKQVQGYLYCDGGPIIGVQVENEYKHYETGLSPEDAVEHIAILKKMLMDIGFTVPLYTATAWGKATVGNCVPVWGGYCDAPWAPGTDPTPPNENYVFTPNLNDSQIACESGLKTGFSTVEGKFPYLTAELGGGIQPTHHRRPIATGRDLGAMSLSKLGSGANLLGYYVYCGGKNPTGALTTLQEYYSEEMTAKFHSAYYNDLPVMDYDFQAPISTCGLVKDSYRELRRIALFLRDFGSDFSPMQTYFPADNPTDPADLEHLRYSLRHNGKSGFLFVNNYQRRYTMSHFRKKTISFDIGGETVCFRDLDIANGDYFIYPFNLPIGNALLKTAKAQLLCKLNEKTYVFFADGDPAYEIEGDLGDYRIVTISSQDAYNACKVCLDQEYLFISKDLIFPGESGIHLHVWEDPEFKVYPDYKNDFQKIGTDGIFTVYRKNAPASDIQVDVQPDADGYTLQLTYSQKPPRGDAYISICYVGDTAEVYCDGEMVMDQFCNGLPLQLNLTDLQLPRQLKLRILPLQEDQKIYLEIPVTYTDGKAAYMTDVNAGIMQEFVI